MAAFPVALPAQNLLLNADFESIFGREIVLDQGVLPTSWEPRYLSPDTYSVSGDYGLQPGANPFARWEVLTTPASGQRFVAAGLDGETFAQWLTLAPGVLHTVGATIALDSSTGPWSGGETWGVWLYDNDVELPDVLVGQFDPVPAADAWYLRSLEFTAPSNAASYEWFGFGPSTGRGAYMGIDAVTLTAVPEPAHAVLALACGALVALARRRRV